MVEIARGMINVKIELLEWVDRTIPQLAACHHLALITKGDLLDQEKKIERSGLGSYFQHVEVVSHKTPEIYARFLNSLAVKPENFMMVGNSLRSDIMPVLELHGYAVHIPHELTWEHESALPPSSGVPGFYALEHFGQLPALLEQLEKT